MPKEPKCLICGDQAVRIAVEQLHSQSKSIREISALTKRSRASVWRHIKHSGKSAEKPAASRKSGAVRNAAQARQRAAGRCGACGLSIAETDPQSLLRRAERLLWIAETIATTAQRDDDARLALQAVDRARSSLETMMKATGQIGGDGQVTVNVDQRKLGMATMASIPGDFIRRLAAGDDAAIDAVLEAVVGPTN